MTMASPELPQWAGDHGISTNASLIKTLWKHPFELSQIELDLSMVSRQASLTLAMLMLGSMIAGKSVVDMGPIVTLITMLQDGRK